MQTLRVTLYTKPNCRLCDELREDLAALGREEAFEGVAIAVHQVNLDDPAGASLTPDTRRRFQPLVPVLELPTQELRFPPHDYVALRTALLACLVQQ